MALKSKTGFLQCRIEEDCGETAVVSFKQPDQTIIYGSVSKSQLRANFLEVEVLRQTKTTALVTWPVECRCLGETCPGDEIEVSRKFLVLK